MSISEVYVQQFSDNFYHLFSQEKTLLRRTTRERSVTGTEDIWDLIGPTTVVEKTVRHADTPQIDTRFSRRKAAISDWSWWDLIDRQDRIRLLEDPQSDLVREGAGALGRAFDRSIISVFDAIAYGIGDEGSAFTFSSEAAGDFDFSVAPLSVLDMLKVKKALDDGDVPTEGRFILMPPAGFAQILAESRGPNISSKDFAEIKALVHGEIDFFLGCTWIRSTLCPRPAGTARYGFAWHYDSVGLSIGEDIQVDVRERADKGYATQVKVSASFGAVRIQGPGVVRFKLDGSK